MAILQIQSTTKGDTAIMMNGHDDDEGEGCKHCKHETDIALIKDRVKDMGADVKATLATLRGNGVPGLVTRVAVNEKSLGDDEKRMNRLEKFQWINMTAILGAAIKIAFFGG